MRIEDYQRQAMQTAVYPSRGTGDIGYPVLGLAGEAGEIADHAKKVLRDDEGRITPERREKIMDEMGDVLWYLAALATELQVGLTYVAERNLRKLADRASRGKLHGEGDNR